MGKMYITIRDNNRNFPIVGYKNVLFLMLNDIEWLKIKDKEILKSHNEVLKISLMIIFTYII